MYGVGGIGNSKLCREVPRKPITMKRVRLGCLIVTGVVLISCAGLFLTPSRARRALPRGASDIQEYYEDARFGSDFQRCLRARIDESDFDSFATRLDLNRVYSKPEHADLPLGWCGCTEPWWNPPDSLEGVRFEHNDGDNYFAMAKYHNGFVYFVAFSW